MSTLIEKDGKLYKQAKVVMLPTNQGVERKGILKYQKHEISNTINDYKNPIGELLLGIKDNSVGMTKTILTDQGTYWAGELFPQHLYIIDDSEIKEGDWYFYGNRFDVKELNQFKKGIDSTEYLKEQNIKKIIATTDSSLKIKVVDSNYSKPIASGIPDKYKNIHLPYPSKSFIEAYIREYNKGIFITDILVEVILLYKGEPIQDYKKIEHLIDFNEKPERWTNVLKLSFSNEIIIKRVESKVYTQEQVDKFINMIDERIEMSNSHVIAYTIIKNNFLKIFK